MERYVIHVTKNCNMNCGYCYEKDKSSGNVPWGTTKELLDDILKTNSTFSIEFLGGEPLLNFSLIEQCVNYLRNIISVNYYITTNGTILSDKIIRFLKENENVTFAISMDGTRFANSLRVFKNGTNSFDVVVKNIKILLGRGFTNRLLVHIVLHPYNVAYFSESVNFLYSLGVRHIDPGIVENTMLCTQEFQDTFISQHQTVSKRIYMGKYPGLKVTTLNYPPLDDKRVYISNEQDIVIGESYGRAKKDFTQGNKYQINQNLEGLRIPTCLKTTVYENHKRRVF